MIALCGLESNNMLKGVQEEGVINHSVNISGQR